MEQRSCARAAPGASVDRAAGFTLLELLALLVVAGLAAAFLVPPLQEWSARLRLDLASAEVVAVLREARSLAVARQRHVAVKFWTGGDEISYGLYGDGDGDGIRNADIERAIDPRLTPSRPLTYLGRRVRFGFPRDAQPSDPSRPGRPLAGLDDPIRFNRSDLASFGELGTATPGSLYLTDGSRLLAVRVVNRTGRVRVMVWDRRSDTWR